jgi:predicted amidophosphoribosyltransferase
MTAHVLTELLSLLAPPACLACRDPLPDAGARLCPGCVRALPWLGRGGCLSCGLPSHRATACPAGGAAFARAWAPLAYEGVARQVVAALKFRGALPVAELMAAQMAANLPADLRPPAPGPPAPGPPAPGKSPPRPPAPGPSAPRHSAWAVVAVPPQRGRRRRRGFDPAGVLAERFAARAGAPLVGCLRRRDRSAGQLRAGRAERRRAGRLVIEPLGPAPPAILLVDDVHTTGATLDACARALRDAGCRRVAAVTYARTL